MIFRPAECDILLSNVDHSQDVFSIDAAGRTTSILDSGYFHPPEPVQFIEAILSQSRDLFTEAVFLAAQRGAAATDTARALPALVHFQKFAVDDVDGSQFQFHKPATYETTHPVNAVPQADYLTL